MPKHSKIQIQVLQLYRQFLHLAKDRPGIRDYIRGEFKKKAGIPRTDTLRIEQSYRRGQRQLKDLQRTDVQSIGVFSRSTKDKATEQ